MIVLNAAMVQPAFMHPEDDIIVRSDPVSGRRVLNTQEADGWAASVTTFGIGGRLNWHTHDSEQFLYITDGRGIVATKEKEYVVTPGTIVYIPAGENHWHGACEDSTMSHLNIQRAGIHLAE